MPSEDPRKLGIEQQLEVELPMVDGKSAWHAGLGIGLARVDDPFGVAVEALERAIEQFAVGRLEPDHPGRRWESVSPTLLESTRQDREHDASRQKPGALGTDRHANVADAFLRGDSNHHIAHDGEDVYVMVAVQDETAETARERPHELRREARSVAFEHPAERTLLARQSAARSVHPGESVPEVAQPEQRLGSA